jgi:hypothetical protein
VVLENVAGIEGIKWCEPGANIAKCDGEVALSAATRWSVDTSPRGGEIENTTNPVGDVTETVALGDEVSGCPSLLEVAVGKGRAFSNNSLTMGIFP